MSQEVENKEIDTKDSTYNKGLSLEKEFAGYMLSHLGWKHFKIRKQMSSKWNMYGTNVDIIAERRNLADGNNFKKVAIGFYSLALLILGFAVSAIIVDNDGYTLLIPVGLCGVTGFLVMTQRNSTTKEHAWVECKNLKGKAGVKEVQAALSERAAHLATKKTEYKIVETYFVSANGFTEPALKYALDHMTRCFVKSDGTFKEKGYWDNE